MLNPTPSEMLPFTYYPTFIPNIKANEWLLALENELAWTQSPIVIFGKEVMQPRLTAWYATNGQSYTYSGKTQVSQPFTPLLHAIKQEIEAISNTSFNSVLCNLYRHGQDSMGYHADNEKENDSNSPIASLSLGAERFFHIKHRHTTEKHKLLLQHGSLLLMHAGMQANYLHALPKTTKNEGIRINLTFRKTKI